ncbi:MAG TPA: hypothetical protein VM253_11090 [Candidatus Limnocylindrales bacterium]|nr:hypothetical protein [Candidatus Limnocylindrales bacterium]
MQDVAPPAAHPDRPSSQDLEPAFRDLHGTRLHGFALLLTLGDRSLAARLTAQALAAGAERIGELRHPERAAAWLRASVVTAAPRRHVAPAAAERHAGLEPLDVDDGVVAGLAALGLMARAAIIATSVERLDRRDVETIVGRSGAALDRLLADSRRRYLAGYAAAMHPGAAANGPLTTRVRGLAARSLQ